MQYYIRFYSYLAILSIAVILGLIRFRKLDKGGKIFCLLLCSSLLADLISYVMARMRHNNMIVYHIYNPVEFFIVALYFNTTIKTFREKNTGIYIGIAGMVMAVLNVIFLQPPSAFNTYYLLFEGLCIISLCLFSFYQLMLRDSYTFPLKDPHFIIPFLLLFYWCVTFISWGAYEIMLTQERNFTIDIILWIANITFDLGACIVFLLYRRKQIIKAHA